MHVIWDEFWSSSWLLLLQAHCLEVMKGFVTVLSCVLRDLRILVTAVVVFPGYYVDKVPRDGKDSLLNCVEKLLRK